VEQQPRDADPFFESDGVFWCIILHEVELPPVRFVDVARPFADGSADCVTDDERTGIGGGLRRTLDGEDETGVGIALERGVRLGDGVATAAESVLEVTDVGAPS